MNSDDVSSFFTTLYA